MTEPETVCWDRSSTSLPNSAVHRTIGRKVEIEGRDVEFALCGVGIPDESFDGTFVVYRGGEPPADRRRCSRCFR